MKTKQEILDHIQQTESHLKDAKEWAKKAYAKYLNDKKFWGEADFGETDAADSLVGELESKVNTLKWILEE